MPKIFALLILATPVFPWFATLLGFIAGLLAANHNLPGVASIGGLSFLFTLLSSVLSSKTIDLMSNET